jgi:transglutaminase-like putative cysteine protease
MKINSEKSVSWLFLFTLVHILILAPALKTWVVLFSVLSLSAGYLLRLTNLPLTSVPIRRLIQFVFLSLVLTQHTSFQFARTTGGMAAAAASIFFLSRITVKQGLMIIFCNLILLSAGCLRFHATWNPVAVIADVIVLVVATQQLLTVNHDRQALLASLFRTVRLALPIVALMTLIFKFFPQFLPASNFGLYGTSGFGSGELLQAGSISQVSLSSRKSFTVQFAADTELPPYDALYFKGQVLENNEGFTWRASKTQTSSEHSSFEPHSTTHSLTAPTFRQQIVLEPRFSGYLFALDHPISVRASAAGAPVRIQSKGNGVYWAADDSRRMILSVESILRRTFPARPKHTASSARTEALSPEQRNNLLHVPQTVRQDLRVGQVANQLRSHGPQLTYVLAALQDHFLQGGYRYTLEPAQLKSTDLGSFLTSGKAGFCEHYAAVSANLLRMAGYPARIAVGFFGGDWNPVSQKLIVRDSHAHAWIEVWSDALQEWIRFDPTAAVSPATYEDQFQQFYVSGWEWWRWAAAYAEAWFDQIEESAGPVAVFFNVLDEHLPNPDPDSVLVALAGCVVVIAFVQVYFSRRRKKKEADPMSSLYDDFRKILADHGFRIADCETPLAVKKRILNLQQEKPENSAENLIRFLDLFIRARYEDSVPDDLIQRELNRLLRKMKKEKLSLLLMAR